MLNRFQSRTLVGMSVGTLFFLNPLEGKELQCMNIFLTDHTHKTKTVFTKQEVITKPKIRLSTSRNVIYMYAEEIPDVEVFNYEKTQQGVRKYYSKNIMRLKYEEGKEYYYEWVIKVNNTLMSFGYLCGNSYSDVFRQIPD